eukprot:9482582-Pyramimonas_sp.AAC.1
MSVTFLRQLASESAATITVAFPSPLPQRTIISHALSCSLSEIDGDSFRCTMCIRDREYSVG